MNAINLLINKIITIQEFEEMLELSLFSHIVEAISYKPKPRIRFASFLVS
jgi:hypothetical protein